MKTARILTALTIVGSIAALTGCAGDGSVSTAKADSAMAQPELIKYSPTKVDRGFLLFDAEGYTWVFLDDSENVAKFMKGEELAKHVTTVTSAGTIKSDEAGTIKAYQALKPGFSTRVVDDYLWVFESGSPELAAVDGGQELAKHVTKVTADGTIKAPHTEVITAYMAAKPGFVTKVLDGYLWVFYDGAEELAIINAGGELAKHVTKVTADGTIKAPSTETIQAYMAAKPGYATRVVDGYLWVFEEGSKAYETIKSGGELAKHVTKLSATPDGIQTIKAADITVIEGYLAQP